MSETLLLVISRCSFRLLSSLMPRQDRFLASVWTTFRFDRSPTLPSRSGLNHSDRGDLELSDLSFGHAVREWGGRGLSKAREDTILTYLTYYTFLFSGQQFRGGKLQGIYKGGSAQRGMVGEEGRQGYNDRSCSRCFCCCSCVG